MHNAQCTIGDGRFKTERLEDERFKTGRGRRLGDKGMEEKKLVDCNEEIFFIRLKFINFAIIGNAGKPDISISTRIFAHRLK